LVAQLRRMAATGSAAGGLPDVELVRRFADRRDEAAFEVLVWRHGPMVWAVCRRVLRHPQDAEDALQAAVLTLARFARSVGRRGSVAGWLHRVAVNAALKLKSWRAPTVRSEVLDQQLSPDLTVGAQLDGDELAGAVDEELDRLPQQYRAAF